MYRANILDDVHFSDTESSHSGVVAKGSQSNRGKQPQQQDEQLAQVIELFKKTLSHIQSTGNKSARCSNVPFHSLTAAQEAEQPPRNLEVLSVV
jgi:hypothetical protein